MRSPTAPIEEKDKDNPQAREAWFLKGRTAPAGQSAADLRYRAHQRKMQMRALRAKQAAAKGIAPLAGLSITGWSALGPAPMTSDAGTGQDYGTVTGRVNAVAIDPADATGNTVYVGGAFGGLWRSQNAADPTASAVVWTPLTDDQPTLSFGSIAFQPGNVDSTTHLSRVILLGTGEANSAIDSYYGLGILRSADEGASWQLISNAGGLSLKGLGINHLAFSTTSNNTVVAAVGSAPVGTTDGAATGASMRGVYTSTDAGLSWTRRTPTDGATAIDANSATAVVWNAGAGKFFAAIRYHGFYSSSDGLTWTRLAVQPGTGNAVTLAATNCPANPSVVSCPMFRGELAVVPGRNEMYAWYVDDNITDQGVWRTSDGGASWSKISAAGFASCGETDGCGTAQAFFNMSLAAVPSGSATDVYIGAVNEFKCHAPSGTPLACSGGSWLNLTHVYGCSDIARVHPDEHGIDSIVVGGTDVLYFGNDGGVYRALDGFSGLVNGGCGTTNQFDNLNNTTLGSLSQFVSFSHDPANPDIILGGTQDNGSPATNTATTSTSWSSVNSGDGGYNEINQADPTQWFSAYTDVSIQRCSPASLSNCNFFSFQPVVFNTEVGNDSGPFYTPYILDPQAATSELIVGTCRIWRGAITTNNPTPLTLISPNFETGSSTPTCNGGETNQVRAIAAGGPKSGGLSNVLYATTDGFGPLAALNPPGGQIWVTTSASTGISSWHNRTGTVNPSHYTVSDVAIDSSVATGQTAYVTIMGFGTAHVLKTADAGTSWADFSGSGAGMLPDAPANTIVIDSTAGVIYVGTDVGVFTSPTSAANWSELGPAPASGLAGYLPNVPVTKLRLFNSGGQKLLRASTYGRGIWQFSLVLTPDYQITFSDSPQTIYPGQTATFNGKVTAQNGYSGNVALTCTGTTLPATCTPSPSSVAATSGGTTFTVAASGATGDYAFNIHGVGNDANTTTHDAALTLHVADFSLGAPNPATVTAPQGLSGTTTFQVTASGTFTLPIAWTCSGLPSGASCSFSPDPGSVGPVTLRVSATGSTPTGTSTVTITGSTVNPAASRTRTFQLNVTGPQDFTWTGGGSHTVLAGQNTLAYNFTATPSGGSTFAGDVIFACSNLPDPTVACVFNPPQISSGAGATPVSLTITTVGPNTGSGNNGIQRGATRSLWLPLVLPMAGIVMLGLRGRNPSRHAVVAGLLCLTLLGILIACGGNGGGSGPPPPPPPPVSVTVSPSSAVSLYANAAGNAWPPSATQQQFTAVVNNSSNQAVAWAVTGGSTNGSIDANGLYTAPATVPASPNVTVTATAQAGGTPGSGSVTLLTPTTLGTFPSISVSATEGLMSHSQTISLTVQ